MKTIKKTVRSLSSYVIADIIGIYISAFIICLLFRVESLEHLVYVCFLTWILCYVKGVYREILDIKKKAEI